MSVSIPPPSEPFVDMQTGMVNEVWYRFLQENTNFLNSTAGTALTSPVAVADGGTGQTTAAEAIGELIEALSADASPDSAADYVATYDASADTGKKVLLNTLPFPTITEGSWTPAVAFGGSSTGVTYGSRVGRYIQVGDLVTIWCRIVLTANGSGTGACTITGLPATSSTVSGIHYVGSFGSWANLNDNTCVFIPWVDSNSAAVNIYFYQIGGTDPAAADETNILDTADFAFALTYRTGT